MCTKGGLRTSLNYECIDTKKSTRDRQVTMQRSQLPPSCLIPGQGSPAFAHSLPLDLFSATPFRFGRTLRVRSALRFERRQDDVGDALGAASIIVATAAGRIVAAVTAVGGGVARGRVAAVAVRAFAVHAPTVGGVVFVVAVVRWGRLIVVAVCGRLAAMVSIGWLMAIPVRR